MRAKESILVHVPHASDSIPECYRSSILLTDTALRKEHDILTDWHMDKLFSSVDSVIFPYSRLFCDVERYSDDEKEPMAGIGMGCYYLKTHDGKELRRYNESEREAILREFYQPHHEMLTSKTQEVIDRHGFCVLIDCHSYDDTTPWVAGKECPDICLGLNAGHPEIEQAVNNLCVEYGYTFAVNTPFAGSIIPNGIDESKLFSVMLEVNKRVYGGRDKDIVPFQRLQEFAESFIQLLLRIL